MVIFEDLHWIDEETQAFLNLLADSIGTAKILLLVNYRPEYSHQWGQQDLLHAAAARPARQGERPTRCCPRCSATAQTLAPLKRVIIERTEGNPFFMEETVQVLLDEGALVRNGVGASSRGRSASSRFRRRCRRSSPRASIDCRRTPRICCRRSRSSAREFPLSLIRAVVSKSDDELDRMLDRACSSASLSMSSRRVGDTEYAFKHALTQEVAYNSVLMERRRHTPRTNRAALERLYANSIDDHLDELAHHYSRSGNSAKALDYHEQRRSSSRSALGVRRSDAEFNRRPGIT